MKLLIPMLLPFVATCAPSLSLGPQVRTEYVIMHPGRPVQVLQNKALKARTLDGSGDAVEQDLGGWIAMPSDHWAVVKKQLEKE